MWNRMISSGVARARLQWLLAALCVLGGVALLLWPRSPTTTVAVTTTATQPSWPKPRCPARTLEDDGVCVPVPPPPETAARMLALQADRPKTWDAYRLPIAGASASLVALQQAPVPAAFRVAGGALVLRAAPGTPVRCPFAAEDTAHVAAVDREAGWLLFRHRSQKQATPLIRLLLLAGLKELNPELVEGSRCEPELVVGRAQDALSLALRRVESAAVDGGVSAPAQFVADSSLTEDVRNLLPLLGP